MFLIYTTYPDSETAQQITNELLDQRLIACANTLPIESAYWWQGAICREGETAVLLKTSAAKRQLLEKHYLALHPYDVPCFVYWEAHANADYEAWIEEMTSNKP